MMKNKQQLALNFSWSTPNMKPKLSGEDSFYLFYFFKMSFFLLDFLEKKLNVQNKCC